MTGSATKCTAYNVLAATVPVSNPFSPLTVLSALNAESTMI
ncbi:MAG: hypothetical protein AB7F29_13840 [Candidatus Nitrosocosmicus sp.]